VDRAYTKVSSAWLKGRPSLSSRIQAKSRLRDAVQSVMAVTEVFTGFRQGQASVKRREQWQFMKMASVQRQMALRWEKRG
jgi:hypothetical protein